MASDISDLMRRAVATALPVVQKVQTDQFSMATPCAEYDVRALLNHMFQVVVSFQALARKEPVDLNASPDYLTGDWATRFQAETEKTVQAWSEPAALEGVSAEMGLPQPVLAQILLLDLTAHGWDLASATGQEHHPDPEVVDVLSRTVTEMAPMARKKGVFGEPVAVPDGAPAFERLLGATGRDPAWKP